MTENTINELARLTASHMPKGWSYTPGEYDHRATLTGPDGAVVSLVTGPTWAPVGKVRASGDLPRGAYDVLRYNETRPDGINVSMSRGPEVLAREIVRRLLPGYLPVLATVTERLARQAANRDAQLATARLMAQAFPGGSYTERHTPEDVRFGHGSCEFYGSVKVRHDGTATDIELHGVSTDLAYKIAALLRDNKS